MVPKIAARGASFKGAGQYYLHDKGADTNARVEFTLTQNLPSDDPELALKIMAHTAMRQQQLKKDSGQVQTGRKLTKPVYTYSLSWSPNQEPTKEQMIEAAQETIKLLGLDAHEILMVAHNDTAHPHIHVIANRVHPENGLAAKLSSDRLVLSKWAEEYERKHGKILCEQRVENNQRRANGEFVKYKAGRNAADIQRWRKARVEKAIAKRKAERDQLAATHKGERDALYDQKETKIAASREEIREQNRKKWAELFKRHERERLELEKQMSGPLRRLMLKDEDRAVRRLAYERSHRRQRDLLQKAGNVKIKKAAAEINKTYKKDLAALKDRHRLERQDLAAKHSRESQKSAATMAAGKDMEAYQKDIKRGKEQQVSAATNDKPSLAPPPPKAPVPGLTLKMSPPIGPAHEAKQKRALATERDQKIQKRIIELKEQYRPQWAALFKRQRGELKALDQAQQAALPRLFYHLRHSKQDEGSRFVGAVKALIGGKDDLKSLEQRHESERRVLGRAVRRERRALMDYEEKAYERDLANLEKELAGELAAFEKAALEGQGGRAPESRPAPGKQAERGDFAARVRARIEEAKRREEERNRGRGRDDGGRERE